MNENTVTYTLRRQDGVLNYCQKSKATKQIKTKKAQPQNGRGVKKANNEQNDLVHVDIIMLCLSHKHIEASFYRFTRTTVS